MAQLTTRPKFLSFFFLGFASLIATSFALLILLHLILTDFLIGLSIFCGYLIIVLLVSVCIYAYLSIIALHYRVDQDSLKIVRLRNPIKIRYPNIKSINILSKIPKRFFENGIYFSGPYGTYRRTKLKNRFLFFTITHQKVYICCNNDVEYIITPENPHKFIQEIQARISNINSEKQE